MALLGLLLLLEPLNPVVADDVAVALLPPPTPELGRAEVLGRLVAEEVVSRVRARQT